MEKINSILDREPISSEQIRSKQDFNQIMKEVKLTKQPFYKTGWFYGTTGLASIAAIVGVSSLMLSDNVEAQEKSALKAIEKFQDENIVAGNQVLIAQADPIEQETDEVIQIDEVVRPAFDKSSQKPVRVNSEKEVTTNEIEPVVETIIEKEPEKAITRLDATSYGYAMRFPRIGNVEKGRINVENLCSNNKIESDGVVITSFSIMFYDGHETIEKEIEGNVIPSDVCAAIEKYNLKRYIYFTNIRGVSERGEIVVIQNMNLVPTKD